MAATQTRVEAEKLLNEILRQKPQKKQNKNIPKQKNWFIETAVSAGGGYDSNALYSPTEEKSSSFFTTGVNVFGYLPQKRKNTGSFYALLENKHFFSLEEGDAELTVFGTAQWKTVLMSDLKAGADLTYSHYEKFYDTSLYDLEQASLLVQQDNFGLMPFLEKNLKKGWTGRLALGGSTTWYGDEADDYDTIKIQTDLLKKYKTGKKLSLRYALELDEYDQKQQKNLQGQSISGSELDTARHTLKMKYTYLPYRKSPWQLKTMIKSSLKKDNGQAYYDYTLYRGEQSVRYRKKDWMVEGKINLSYYDYHERDVMGYDDYSDRGLDPALASDIDTVHRFSVGASCRVEKAFTRSWKLYFEGEYLNSQSNEIISVSNDTNDYDLYSVSMGVIWKYSSF